MQYFTWQSLASQTQRSALVVGYTEQSSKHFFNLNFARVNIYTEIMNAWVRLRMVRTNGSHRYEQFGAEITVRRHTPQLKQWSLPDTAPSEHFWQHLHINYHSRYLTPKITSCLVFLRCPFWYVWKSSTYIWPFVVKKVVFLGFITLTVVHCIKTF